MTVDDRLLEEDVRPDKLERIWRVGLRSCWLLLREREPLRRLADVVLCGLRVGEESREARGECVAEVLAEDC